MRSMKRFILPMTLLVVLAFALGGWFVVTRPVAEQLESARSRDGLHGAVKKVTVATAPLVQRSGTWVAADSRLESETVYTPRGTLSEVSRYSDNALEYRLDYLYENDLLARETSFGPDDQPLYTWLHVYDESGRLTSLSGYNDRSVLEVKTLYSYDAEGRLLTETSYSADDTLSYEAKQSYAQGYARSTVYFAQGAAESTLEETFDQSAHRLTEASYSPTRDLQYRVEYHYTDQGDLSTESAFSADGSVAYRLENRYDDAGRLLEATEYDADHEPFYRYSYAYNDKGDLIKSESRSVDGSGSTLTYAYSYDKHGNWTERRAEKLVTRLGEEVVEPSEVTRRTLSYY